MTKQDLRTGMVVETLEGKRYFLVIEQHCLMGEIGWCDFNNYTTDLVNREGDRWNIVKVYKGRPATLSHILDEPGDLIWERNKAKELTVSDIEKLLGFPVKIVGKKVEYKVGDRVRVIKDKDYKGAKVHPVGTIGTIIEIDHADTKLPYYIKGDFSRKWYSDDMIVKE